MSELMMILQVLSATRVVVSEGLSTIRALKDYTAKSATLTTADKEQIMAQIVKIDEDVQASKFTDV